MFLKEIENVPILMQKLFFKRATMLERARDVTFYVNILKQSGNFEIFESGSIVATGNIKLLENSVLDLEDSREVQNGSDGCLIVKRNNFYKEMQLRRYNYQNLFRGIKEFHLTKQYLKIEWFEKFDCFLDTILQVNILSSCGTKDFLLPTYIEKLMIDPEVFLEQVSKGK